MRKYLFCILLSLLWVSHSFAQKLLSPNAKVYLLTCTPGTEVWTKYGHTGIYVDDPDNQLDIVFNYGNWELSHIITSTQCTNDWAERPTGRN